MKRTLMSTFLLSIILSLMAQEIRKTGDGTSILIDGIPVLTYVHTETLPPDGIDPIYRRSAYIHPLRSPGGEVLTRIQPPDHYHHYGIWNPWTRTRIGERGLDFWNLGSGQGTVRFAEYLGMEETGELAGFRAKQEHVFFPGDGTEKVAINEIWDVKVKKISGN
ncbi:MAG: PmoA family protein, partial [Bacteroidales bacterium]|nr:PmoA family protein [Bacteroidales bacterium]